MLFWSSLVEHTLFTLLHYSDGTIYYMVSNIAVWMAYCVVSIPIIYPQMNMIFSHTLVDGHCRQQARLNDCTDRSCWGQQWQRVINVIFHSWLGWTDCYFCYATDLSCALNILGMHRTVFCNTSTLVYAHSCANSTSSRLSSCIAQHWKYFAPFADGDSVRCGNEGM